jgi:hypothetical protein
MPLTACLPGAAAAVAPAFARRRRAAGSVAAAPASRPRASAAAANGTPAVSRHAGASKHPTGVPPRMGEHTMASGRVAPPSFSTTVNTGAPHMFQYHNAETPVSVEARAAALRASGE